MFAESHPIIRQLMRFCALPLCFLQIDWSECAKGKFRVIGDLLHIFFRLRYYPDNYSPCRLWEKEREEWKYYYGSTYHPWSRNRLRREVQPFEWSDFLSDKVKSYEYLERCRIPIPETLALIHPDSDSEQILKDAMVTRGILRLILKPVYGSGGRGIYLAEREGGAIMIKTSYAGTPISRFHIQEPYLAQELLTQDSRISAIYHRSINTIRTVTLLTHDGSVIIMSSSIRFGVGDSFVDNWSAGGVAVGVDHKRGVLCEYAYDKKGRKYRTHPDSCIAFLGFHLPYWRDVLCLSEAVQKSIPFYRLLGLDIALTPDGPVLVELNPNPDIIFQEQTAGPLLKDERVRREMSKYGLLFNRYQRSIIY